MFETKMCNQCMQTKPTSQFKTYPTQSGLKYRSICHQCEYDNHRFNTLQKQVIDKTISDDDYENYRLLLTLFDTYSELGGHISSGAYNELRGKTFKERTLEEQLASAQQALAEKRNASEYANKIYCDPPHSAYLLDAGFPAQFVNLLVQKMSDWCELHYKPSFLRQIHKDYKAEHAVPGECFDTDWAEELETFATKIWDYEEYLSQTYGDQLPDWLDGEELLV